MDQRPFMDKLQKPREEKLKNVLGEVFIPLENSFILSMAIRESEKDFFIRDENFKVYREIVASAPKYSEGYNVKFVVKDGETYNFSKEFIKGIMTQR